MWRFMVGLGLLLALAGLVVVALGVAIFVSSFGNTLIAAGAVFLSGGITLAAVGLVLKQLLDMSERLDAALAGGALAAARPLDAADEDFAPAPGAALRDEPEEFYEEEEEEEEPAPALPPRSFVPPPFTRQPAPERPAALPEAYRPEPARHEPPRHEPARHEPPRPDFARPEPARAEMPRSEQTRLPEALQRGRVLGRTPEGEHFADRMRPQPAFVPPAPEPEAPVERAPERPVERAPMVTRPFTPPSCRPDQGAAPVPPPAPPAPVAPPAAAEPSVLKSGVVGGMAYTLYSDGSIQAELPDGTLRFASLQELRDHVARSNQG